MPVVKERFEACNAILYLNWQIHFYQELVIYFFLLKKRKEKVSAEPRAC